MIVFAYMLRIAEAPIARVVNEMDHSDFYNCLWETAIVMTTGILHSTLL